MYSVVMAGGSGTRFWPYSRRKMPKQLLNIMGKGPMIVKTCDRMLSVSTDEEMIIILGESHYEATKKLFPDRKISILAEPVGRNTAPCIGLGALYARHLGCDGPLAFLPADHFIGDVDAFLSCLESAGKASESGAIVTLGIIPSRPETGYGYIKRAEELPAKDEHRIYKVMEFVEKPDLEKAVKYISSGNYFWNAGIFVATPQTILKEMETCLSDTYNSLLRLEPYFDSPDFKAKFKEVYSEITSESFDYGIMEKTKAEVLVVPCECGWSDVGSWESLYELRADEHDNDKNLKDGDAVLIGCEGSYVSSTCDRLVACMGIKDCIVIDREDAVLVAHMKNSQDIKKIVDELKNKKRDELL